MHTEIKTKVVVIGGGNGSSIVLDALKRYADKLEISGVISMSDSGGSSGAIRKKFKMLPPGDIMRAVVALSKYDFEILRKIFYKNRLSATTKLNKDLGAERGPNLGNLIFALVTEYEGDILRAIAALEEAVEAVGHAYPVTLDSSDLCAELLDGTIVKTEAALDEPSYDRSLKIKRVWLEPNVSIYDGARQALESAEYIFLSPGSLYTSVIATLLPHGVKEAIAESKAKLIFVAGDAYELEGETGPEKLSDFVSQLEKYLPRPLDMVIYNNAVLTLEQQKKYEEKKWGLFAVDVDNIVGKKVVGADFSKEDGGLSGEKLGGVLDKIMKYKIWK